MTERPTNPSAFPIPPSDLSHSYAPEQGMSLRDHFAGQALSGAMQKYQTPSLIAEYCYHVADAMLAERMKEPQ